jgi:hypothetical protein
MANPILEKYNIRETSDILDTLTKATVDTEGLIPGQTPLRINPKNEYKNTIQGVPLDKEIVKPADRKNFYFVKPDRVKEVIKKQWRNYFKNPTKYGLSEDATLEDAIRLFDQQNPQNKINYLKQKGIDVKKKLKEFDISSVDPFAVKTAYARPTTQLRLLRKNPILEKYKIKERPSFSQRLGKISQRLGKIAQRIYPYTPQGIGENIASLPSRLVSKGLGTIGVALVERKLPTKHYTLADLWMKYWEALPEHLRSDAKSPEWLKKLAPSPEEMARRWDLAMQMAFTGPMIGQLLKAPIVAKERLLTKAIEEVGKKAEQAGYKKGVIIPEEIIKQVSTKITFPKAIRAYKQAKGVKIKTPMESRLYAGVPIPSKEALIKAIQKIDPSQTMDILKGFSISQLQTKLAELRKVPTKQIKPVEIKEELYKFFEEERKKLKEEKVSSAMGRMTKEELKEFYGGVEELEKDPATNLFKAIKELGGIKKGEYWKEEIKKVPLYLRNDKSGLYVDDLVTALKSHYGWRFDSPNDLLDRIDDLTRAKAYATPMKIRRTPKAVHRVISTAIKKAKPLSQKVERIGKLLEKLEVVTREYKATRLQKLKEQIKQRREKLKIKLKEEKEAKIQKAKELIQQRREKLYAQAKKARLIKEIKKRLKTKGLKWGYQDKVKELADSVILKKIPKTEREALEKFGKWVEEQQAEGVEIIQSNLLKDLGKRSIYEMDTSELQELDKVVKNVVHQGRLKNRLIAKQYSQTIDEIADRIDKSIKKSKPPSPPPVKLGEPPPQDPISNAKDFFRSLHRIERFLEHAGSGRNSPEYQFIWKPVNDSWNNYTISHQEKLKQVENYLKKNHPTSKDIAREIKPVKINERLKLTPSQYKMVYIYSLSEKGRQHLLEGNLFTEQDLKDVERIVESNPLDMKDVQFVLDIMEKYWSRVNNVYRKIYGIDLPRLPNYFHFFLRDIMEGKEPSLSEIFAQPDFIQRALAKGFLKPRKGGRAPLQLDLWHNLSRSIGMFEKYINMGLAERDVRKIINHPKTKNAIIDEYGEEWYRDLKQWFGDVFSGKEPQDLSPIDNIFRWLRLQTPVSLLYMNVMVPVRQTGSLALGFNRVGLKKGIPALLEYIKNPVKIDNLIYQKDPIQKYRRVERDIEEIIKRRLSTIKGLTGKPGTFEFGIKPVIFFDRRTSNCVWWMAYKKYLRENTTKIIDPDKLEKKAIDYAQYVVRQTQPAWTMKDLPSLYRKSSEITKGFTMFQNYPNQLYNELIPDTFRAYKEGKIGKIELMSHLWWILVVSSFLYGTSRRWRLPTLKEALVDILLQPLSFIPMGRDFAIVLEAKLTNKPLYDMNFTIPPFIFFNSALKTIAVKKPITKLKYAVRTAAFGLGIPYTQLYRTFRGLNDLLRGETRDLRRLFVSEWALKRPKEEKIKLNKNPILEKYKIQYKLNKNPILEKYGL